MAAPQQPGVRRGWEGRDPPCPAPVAAGGVGGGPGEPGGAHDRPRMPTAPRSRQLSHSRSHSRAAQPRRRPRAPVPCHLPAARAPVPCRPRGTGALPAAPLVPAGSAGAHLDACPVLPHGCPAHRGRADRARRSTPAAGESRLPKADEPAPCIPAWHGLTRDERSRGMNATGEGIIHRSTSINPAHIVHEILSDPCHSYPETPGKNKKPKP